MDFEKIKVGIYDVLALLIPGMGLLGIIGFSVLGGNALLSLVKALNGSLMTAVLAVSWALGHLVQEMADWWISTTKPARYSKKWRDDIWSSSDGEILKKAIAEDGGSVSSADAAFDFCLSKAKSVFEKRDAFVATADFSRVMVIVGALGSAAFARLIYDSGFSGWTLVGWIILGVALISIWCLFFWRRMLRYREYSERPVFYVYLAQRSQAYGAEKGVGGGISH